MGDLKSTHVSFVVSDLDYFEPSDFHYNRHHALIFFLPRQTGKMTPLPPFLSTRSLKGPVYYNAIQCK